MNAKKMPAQCPNKLTEEIEEPLTDVQEKIAWIIKYCGTNTQGPAYKIRQQARMIDELYFELNEGAALVRDFRYIKVVPA